MSSISEKRPGPGRPRKTTTIRQRTLRIYLPTLPMVDEWKSLAKDHNQSLSKFVIERVEDSLNHSGEGPRHSRKELIDKLYSQEGELRRMRDDLDMKTKAYKVLHQELRMLRTQPFLNPEAQSMKDLNVELIRIFRTQGMIKYDELLPTLRIQPTDQHLVKGISNQIDILIHFGLVTSDLKGWRWVK
jgi:hypothetical protein